MASNDKVAEAKKKAQAQVQAQQRKAMVLWVVAAVILVGLFAALVAFIVRENKVSTIDTSSGQLVPAVASDNNGFGFGKSDTLGEDPGKGKVRLDVYFDFMCPYCGIFETTQTETLNKLRSEGVIDVYYHPIAFLDRASSGTQYSTRSAAASVLIAQEAPDKWLAFVQGMFKNQPAENTKGLSDEEIQKIAKDAGVPDDVVAKIPDHAYADWVTKATEDASAKDNITFTPSLVVDGKLQDVQNDSSAINWAVEGGLESGLRKAAEGK